MRGDRHRMAGKLDEHHGAGFGAALEYDGAAMVLHDFGDDREAEAGAVGFAGADKGIERGRADRRWNAAALVDDADFESVLVILNVDRDAAIAVAVGNGFAGVQHEVEKRAFEFFGIEYAFGGA